MGMVRRVRIGVYTLVLPALEIAEDEGDHAKASQPTPEDQPAPMETEAPPVAEDAPPCLGWLERNAWIIWLVSLDRLTARLDWLSLPIVLILSQSFGLVYLRPPTTLAREAYAPERGVNLRNKTNSSSLGCRVLSWSSLAFQLPCAGNRIGIGGASALRCKAFATKPMRWLPILFRNSNFPAETSFEEMMQARVPVSFHYTTGWGMDEYHICFHLQDRHHSDLSKLVDHAETKNDVVYVIQVGQPEGTPVVRVTRREGSYFCEVTESTPAQPPESPSQEARRGTEAIGTHKYSCRSEQELLSWLGFRRQGSGEEGGKQKAFYGSPFTRGGACGGGGCAVKLLIEIQKCITNFQQSGLNLWVGSAESTTIATRSTVEFPGMVIREAPLGTTPIQFLRELEKRLRVKHRIHITSCHLLSAIHYKFRDPGYSIPIKELTKGMSGRGRLLDVVHQAETLGISGVRNPQVSVLWGAIKHIRQESKGISFLHRSGQSNVPLDVQQAISRSGMSKVSLYTPVGQKMMGDGGRHWAGSFSSEFPIQIEAPIKKTLRRLRDRGLISRRRPSLIHVTPLTNISDRDIVNRSAGIAISPMSYYRCRDNLCQVRTIVDHQIRWSAIFTTAHKHKSSVLNIIPKYPKHSNSNIVNQEGSKTLAEFPNNIEHGKLRPGQDPNKDKELNYI
ncbi:uncharacterized protein LOC120268538 [Dioscorea cayenensis subsp. rotundata]|uniref:Uncharacterized protein LOC120268538 n=1 Tax=Dioscorea cayennensis subsp. rotundata TaxID=55577 RepID=A0AB40BWI3_DIOCR|nr:uncharacterized protein LOC120268538 [Dioscorea cayenensis subsp. rotundata]